MTNKPNLKKETRHVKIILEDKSLNDTDEKVYRGMKSKTFSFISIISFDTAVEMDFANGSIRIFLRDKNRILDILMDLQTNKITNRMNIINREKESY